MLDIAKYCLAECPQESRRFCFHVPPFNSIDHLHLHAIGRIYEMSWFNMQKYYLGSFWCKSAEDLIKTLRKSANRPSQLSASSVHGVEVRDMGTLDDDDQTKDTEAKNARPRFIKSKL